MKWDWMCLKRGGGCKKLPYFCPFCADHRDSAYARRDPVCHSCDEKERERCYHTKRVLFANKRDIKASIRQIKHDMGGVDYTKEKWFTNPRPTAITLMPVEHNVGAEDDSQSIYYRYTGEGRTQADRRLFLNNVVRELQLRKMSLNGNSEDMVRGNVRFER